MSPVALPHWRRLGWRALPGILFLLLVLLVYADPLFFRRNFSGRDLLVYNVPMEKAIHDAYAQGRLPLWTPDVSGGRPLLPNPNIGSLYPIRVLLAAVPFPLALRLYPVLHWAAAGLGTMLLLRAIGASLGAAWIGAVTYAFSGVAISEVFFPHIQPGMALLPWILWQLHRPFRSRFGQALSLSFLFALDLLAADVFTVTLAIVCAALWIVLEEDRREHRRAFLRLGLALSLAGLAAAPQIVATALWIPETNRAVLGMKLSEATRFSLSPLRLVEFLVPYPFGATWELKASGLWAWKVFNNKSMGLFSTLYVGALGAMAVGSLWRKALPGARFERALLVVGLGVCVSPSLFPVSWGQIHSPLPLRNPEKFVVAPVLAVALLAGRAFDLYRQERRRPKWDLAIGSFLAVSALLCSVFRAPMGQLAAAVLGGKVWMPETAARQLPAALAEAGLLWMLTVLALEWLRRPGRAALVGSLGLLTLVPIAANGKIPGIIREEDALAPTAFALRLRRADPSGSYRTLDESVYSPRPTSARGETIGLSESTRDDWSWCMQVLWNRGTVFNYDFDSGDLARVESLRRLSSLASGFRDSAVFFGNLALRWGIRFQGQEPIAGYRRVGASGVQLWDEHELAFPDIRLATRWREEVGSIAALRELPLLAPGEVLLETGRRARGTARAGGLRIVQRSPNRLLLETNAPDDTWLFVLRAFWNHRSITLDGREVECAPAYLAFSGVHVPAGRHRIQWREHLPGGTVSVWGTITYGVLLVGLLGADFRRRRA